MRAIRRNSLLFLVAMSLPITSAWAQTPSPEAKAKVQAQAQAKAKAKASRLKASLKRNAADYESCFDQCMNDNDCGSDYGLSHAACVAGWTLGCRDGCGSLKP
jgi:hypothetical protein